MAEASKNRLAYVDWMRGLACLLMFQTHCYDSWLSPEARRSKFFMWSQLSGTLPAPLFLFLAGVSFALVTERMRQKGIAAGEIAATTIRRGAEIFALGLLFRVQEFLLGFPHAPWTDLLRVDILNMIGLSIMLMGVLCWLAKTRRANILAAAFTALAIAMATPLVWTSWRPRFLPWFLETYFNGVHTFGAPQFWLFPLFPWSAFAFAGLAAGFLLMSDWSRRNLEKSTAIAGVSGLALFALALRLDALSIRLYPVYDFWHTSPNFFLARVGVLLLIVWLSFAWCRWGAGQWGFSPLIQLGQTSLIVYWVHIEFVYGSLSILPKHRMGIPGASLGLLAIFVAMVLLSICRTRLKGRGLEWLKGFRHPAAAAGPARPA